MGPIYGANAILIFGLVLFFTGLSLYHLHLGCWCCSSDSHFLDSDAFFIYILIAFY